MAASRRWGELVVIPGSSARHIFSARFGSVQIFIFRRNPPATATLQNRVSHAGNLHSSLQGTWDGCLEAPERARGDTWVVGAPHFQCPIWVRPKFYFQKKSTCHRSTAKLGPTRREASQQPSRHLGWLPRGAGDAPDNAGDVVAAAQ